MDNVSYVIDTTQQSFNEDVIERSYQTPVLVDFWADWCQPCKALMPLLSQIVAGYEGKVFLAKVNTDTEQALTAHWGIRSLPTVKLFKDGVPVDEFMGVQPESAIHALLAPYLSATTEPLRQQALMLYQQGDHHGAVALLQQVIEQEPSFYEAQIDLATLHFEQGEGEAAQVLLDNLPEAQKDAERVQVLLKQLKIAALREDAGDIDSLQMAVESNPTDVDLILQLAKAKVAVELYAEGMDDYLQAIKLSTNTDDMRAREGLLETFDLLGAAEPLVKRYRNKLFSMMH